MFYGLSFDMDRIDKAIEEGTNTIFADKTNLDEIEYRDVKVGYFEYVITEGKEITDWPNVEFYYDSRGSTLESEYLLNVATWPIVHKGVQEEFEKEGIKGIQYLPIKLIDAVTGDVNNNYLVMNVVNFIEAYDMEKSTYTYSEKYNTYSFLPHQTYLDEEECSKYDIFRCNKDSIIIYVSEKIVKIIEKNNWVGFTFRKWTVN